MSVLKTFPSIEQESDQKKKKKKEQFMAFFLFSVGGGNNHVPLSLNKEKHNCIQHRNIINISTVERQCLAWISHAGSLIQSVRQPFIICMWVYTLPTISVKKRMLLPSSHHITASQRVIPQWSLRETQDGGKEDCPLPSPASTHHSHTSTLAHEAPRGNSGW